MRALWALVGGSIVTGALLLACTAETRSYGGFAGGGPVPNTSSGSSGNVAVAEAMLVDVDTDRTMTAQAGDGVGVFTEYAAGGHWRVFWTCDTNRTNFDCGFDVGISTSGQITNANGDSLEAADQLQLAQAATGNLGVVAQTSTAIKGVTFDTTPGAVITLDVTVDGQRDGKILFFVQDGRVNGGYAGNLADPLMLEPSSP
jgi:hypothetical protein